MKSRFYTTLLFLFIGIQLHSQSFKPGNVVVVRVGDGVTTLSDVTAPLFLEEYSPTGGAPIQTIPLPTSLNGINKRLTIQGTNRYWGRLTLSENEQYLAIAGLDVAPGTTSAIATAATVQRVIGLVDYNGVVNASTGLTGFSGALRVPSSAITSNGSSIWACIGSGGTRYATIGSSTSVTISSNSLNRVLGIYDGNLYTNNEAGELIKVGNGLPTTGPQTLSTLLPGSTGGGIPNGFFMADLDPAIPGCDVIYLAGDQKGLQKYSLIGSNWINKGIIGTSSDVYINVTGVVNGSIVTLYAIRKGNVSPSELVALQDNTGQIGSIAGLIPTLLASSATNTSFRGVAMAPIKCKKPILKLGATSPVSMQVFVSDSLISGGPYEYAISTSTITPASGTLTNSNMIQDSSLSPGTHYYLYVRRNCGGGDFSQWTTIDFITSWPPCTQPTNLVQSVSGINTIFSWDQVFTAIKYEYEVTTEPLPTASGMFVTGPIVTVPALQSAKKYYLHVRAYCGGGDTSMWVTKIFTSNCFTPIPYLVTNNWQPGTAILGWHGEFRDQVFEYAILKNEAPIGGSSRLTNDTVITVRDLIPGSKYYLSIRQRCTSGAVSDWGKLEFYVSGVHVFPNPAQDYITIRVFGQEANGKMVSIYDANGRHIVKLSLSGNSAIVKLRGWSSGVYFVRFVGDHEYHTRFIKQ